MTADSAGPFLHGFEQRRLCLGRSAVNLVGQDYVTKNGALHEGPLAMPGSDIFFDDVGPRYVGRHQIGGELDAPETEAECLRDGPHHECFGRTGQPGNQAVATDEQGGEDLIEHFILADDDLPHLGENAVTDRIKPLDAMLQLGCVLAKFRGRYHRQFPSSPLHDFLRLTQYLSLRFWGSCPATYKGAPHLARFWRDWDSTALTPNPSHQINTSRSTFVSPTSRQKRARCGAPLYVVE